VGVSGVTTIQDGLPFTITDGLNGNQATLLYGTSLPATGPVTGPSFLPPSIATQSPAIASRACRLQLPAVSSRA